MAQRWRGCTSFLQRIQVCFLQLHQEPHNHLYSFIFRASAALIQHLQSYEYTSIQIAWLWILKKENKSLKLSISSYMLYSSPLPEHTKLSFLFHFFLINSLFHKVISKYLRQHHRLHSYKSPFLPSNCQFIQILLLKK